MISPDGTLVVFPAGEGPTDKQRLFFRRLDQLTTTALPATEGAYMPFFSPDGKSVGFLADNQLKTIRLDATASPVVICAARSFLGGAWAADGTIIFGSFGGLQRVVANGGVPQPVTIANPLKSDIAYHLPSLLPGGRALLISVHDGDALFRIDVLTLATGERRTVVARGYHAEYSPTGHIVYAAGDALFAIPFDGDRLTATGTPVKLLDGVETDGGGGFALSATGTLVFQPQPPPAHRTLVWADRSGVTTQIPIEPRTFWTPRLSPDGRQFAVVVDDKGRRNIWIYRFDNATFLPIASEGINRAPVWTRDGLRLTYLSERDGVRHLMSQPSDSSAPAESLLTSQNDDLFPGSWSADGRSLVYVDQRALRPLRAARPADRRASGRDAVRHSCAAATGRRSRPTAGGWRSASGRPRHPGGQRSTYRPFPGPGPSRQFVDAAGQPVWSRDGEKIFFRSRRGGSSASSGDGIFEMPFDRSRGIAAGPERQLFRKAFAEDAWMGVAGYDVAPDGRFLLVIPDESESLPFDMHVLLHVDDELRRRVVPVAVLIP